ncbi:MAG TPA: tetratricopeptide repeat protein [Candidatus Methylacidiphilales bacterium]|jgi:tetratricopeptide (TPR) repeat protein|nr:tetratricopeptide repeat protein [Candidatus Methylacidiphilales bacterium]
MKERLFPLFLPVLALGSGPAPAQTNPPPTPPPHVIDVPQPVQPSAAASDGNLDPAKIAEYQKRFQQGYALEQQGKLAEARANYDAILAEQPQAKRSLLEAGKISFKLGEFEKADNYLERLNEIVPDFPEAIELLIQINQALKRDVKVELLIRDFAQLRAGGKIPELSQSLWFTRELIHSASQDIVINQAFDYTRDPNTVWMAEVFDPTGILKRRILLNYDPEATRALRAKEPNNPGVQVFTWVEHVLKDGQPKEIDVYMQIFALPDYQKFRSALFVILATPPKPIYSAPVDPSQH